MQSFPSYQLNNGLGVSGRQSNDILNLTVTNTLNYRFDVRHDHHFNVMVGQEGVDYQAEGFNVTTRGQNNDFLTNVTSGTRASSWQDNTTAYSFLSFFGRAEYNYDDRYYVELGLRTDASSRFGMDHRWGKFWSVGLMLNAKKERFLQKYDWLHNAQVSFSTGTSGNSEIPNFDHLALASGGWIYMDAAGIAPFNLRVQAGLLPQGLFPAVSFRPDPAGDFRLTHQFSGKGIELLFGNKGWEDLHCQRDHQHGAEHQDAHIDVSLSASGSQNPFQHMVTSSPKVRSLS